MVVVFAAPSTPVVDQLWPLAVTGIFTLLGVGLGKTWERRGGDAAWLREQRLRAYSEFLAAVHACWSHAGTIDLLAMSDPRRAEGMDQFWRLTGDMARAKARVDVVGPKSVAQTSGQCAKACSDLRKALRTKAMSGPLEATSEGAAVRRLHEDFSVQAGMIVQGHGSERAHRWRSHKWRVRSGPST